MANTLYTKELFEQEATNLSERLTQNISNEITTLRTIITDNPDALPGMIFCIKAIHTPQLFQQFMELIPILSSMEIQTRLNDTLPFSVLTFSFFQVMEKNTEEFICKYIHTTHSVQNILNSPEKLSDLYASAIMDVAISLYDDSGKNTYELVYTRFQNTVNFLLEAANSSLEGYDEIHLTGSDPHMLGKQALFVQKDDRQWVYKPRNMQADALLTGSDGWIHYLGERLGEPYQLPCINIDVYENYGIEEFITKKYDFTNSELHHYYRKMGVLAYAAKLAGATDLHQDNIMPTKDGPIIIDAECAFSINIISSSDINATLIRDALCTRNNAFGDDAVSYLTVSGKDSTAFQNVNLCYPDFADGFKTASRYCFEHLGEVSDYLTSLLGQKPLLRCVPVATTDFARAMTFYTDPSMSEEVVNDYCGSILTNLQRAFSIQNIDETVVKNALHTSFENGDIPLIQLEVKEEDSNLRINGSTFATTNVYNDIPAIKNILIASIKYLNEISPDELIAALLPRN